MSERMQHDVESKVAIIFIIAVVLAVSVYDFFIEPRQSKVTAPQKDETKLVESELVTPEPVLNDLLGKAELSYAGGTEGRNKNIEIGVARLSGTVLEPGEEFSFKKFLGPVTSDEGYSEERVFLNGEVQRGIGGGLCQVSSTLFQTVINSGLPVTERANHSFSVVLYDVGLDATYSEPGPDLRFVNDTKNPITIKGKTENQKVIFEIYGVSDGRIASTSPVVITDIVDFPPPKYVATTTKFKKDPECLNVPQIGYTASIYYNVLYPNGDFKTKNFKSTYKPLQRICYVLATSTKVALKNR